MSELQLSKIKQAIKEGNLNFAVEQLKKGIRRDFYWEEGHLLLGDIYLIGLEHYVYALVEYRKLEKIKKELTPLEKIRLAYAYFKRNFEEEVLEIIAEIDFKNTPENFKILDCEFNVKELITEMRGASKEELDNNRDKYFERNLRQGREYSQVADYFRAQKAFERALALKDDPHVRLELAKCQIQRVNFIDAIENLKIVRNDGRLEPEAQLLLKQVYERLGLPINYEEQKPAKSKSGQRKAG